MINGDARPGCAEFTQEARRSKDELKTLLDNNFAFISGLLPSLSGSNGIVRKTKRSIMRVREAIMAIMYTSLISVLIMVVMALLSAKTMPWIPLVILLPSAAIVLALIAMGSGWWLGLVGMIAAIEIALAAVPDGHRFVVFLHGVKVTIKKIFGFAIALFGAELILGLYLSYIPIANDRQLFPRVALTFMAMLIFFLAKYLGIGRIWGVLGVICLIIVIIQTRFFCLGGADKVYQNVTTPTSIVAPHTPKTTDTAEIAALRDQITTLSAKFAMLTTAGSAQNALFRLGGTTNNPLNIKYSPKVAQLGATDSGIQARDEGTFAQFATPEDGIRAAKIMLTDPSFGYSTLTVDAALKRWSHFGWIDPATGKPTGYGAEIDPDISGNAIVGQLPPNQLDQLIAAMVLRESGSATGPQQIPVAAAPMVVATRTPALGLGFRDGNLEFKILGCPKDDTEQIRCFGYVAWTGSAKSQLILKPIVATDEEGNPHKASVGQFGEMACFQHAFPRDECWNDLYPDGKLSFWFAIDGYKDGVVTVVMPFFYQGALMREATMKVPVVSQVSNQ